MYNLKKNRNLYLPTYPIFWRQVTGTTPIFLFGFINDTYVYIQGSPHMEKWSPTWSAPIKRGESPSKGGEGGGAPIGRVRGRQYDVWPRAP